MTFRRYTTAAPTLKEANGCGPCRFLKSTHTIEILLMRTIRIHPCWSNRTDRVADIIRAKSSSQDNLTHDTKKYMSSLDGWHETRLSLLAIEPDFTNTSIND